MLAHLRRSQAFGLNRLDQMCMYVSKLHSVRGVQALYQRPIGTHIESSKPFYVVGALSPYSSINLSEGPALTLFSELQIKQIAL